jgi:cytochrome c oxidase subunit 2
MRRRIALAACAGLLLGARAGFSGAQPEAGGVRRLPVAAAKFAFNVAEIRARRGETLVIALTASDFVHGFSIPELKARIDAVPGRTVELTLRTLPAGRFTYLCDNFCGDGHDRMTGSLIVV